ncbi:MAG TPA: sulfatase-like hydrolase/transferase [Steroidobacteraceae bacterium]|nr:sulfatase-like hydrolase/transferase [Steroidobacteraceae bacterium]
MYERYLSLARFWPLITLAFWYVCLGAVVRLVLWAQFGYAQQVSLPALLWIFPAGAIADAVQALYLLAPFALFLALLSDRWRASRAVNVGIVVGAFLWMFGLTFVAVAEYFFFEEFDSRFNLVSVDYLMYPTEVVGDIRSEYPLFTVLALGTVVAAIMVLILRKQLRTGAALPVARAGRLRALGAYVALVACAALTFQSSSLGFSRNRVANELASNGAMSFFRAMRTSEIDYGSYYASRDRHKNLAELEKALSQGGGEFTRLAEGRIDREFPARGDGLGKMNVVVIASESFGAEFSKLYGSKRDWTPEFDRFAQKSLWFRHMYASGTRTVRGLEAITASFPPIPSVSIVRRPGNENIANWGSVMRAQGYSTSFLYGGYGYFDNMNYFYANNGFEVLDRKSITRPTRFENIWGVADEDLYDLALDHFDDLSMRGKPFFAIIMNTSNHKPFTFRAGVPGVKPAGGGRESGVRYADFAQGYFLEQAERHGWFDNTLFVVVADHGARVYGKQDIPIKSYEIPMLIYAPKRLNPQRVDALTTQIDVAPTVLGLLGLPYRAPFFGQDVLHTKAADRVVFFSHNHDVAILRGNQLAILGLQKSTENFFYDAATDSYRPAPRNVELNDLAIAYYQTASELFHERRYN